jgi:hypothetical protein
MLVFSKQWCKIAFRANCLCATGGGRDKYLDVGGCDIPRHQEEEQDQFHAGKFNLSLANPLFISNLGIYWTGGMECGNSWRMNTAGFKIISGGQTGADRAALDWAILHEVDHGGWCPKRRKAEDGPIDPRYKLKETPISDYLQRTKWNVMDFWVLESVGHMTK